MTKHSTGIIACFHLILRGNQMIIFYKGMVTITNKTITLNGKIIINNQIMAMKTTITQLSLDWIIQKEKVNFSTSQLVKMPLDLDKVMIIF